MSPLKGFDEGVVDIVSNKTLALGKWLELDINEEEIHETDEELMELQEERRKAVEAEEDIIMLKAPKKFTARKLADAFATSSRAMKMLEMWTAMVSDL